MFLACLYSTAAYIKSRTYSAALRTYTDQNVGALSGVQYFGRHMRAGPEL